MVKRKWAGDPTCQFCNEIETVDHLFLNCVVARVIWGIVAQCLGANNIPSNVNPVQVIIHPLQRTGVILVEL
jgi:hypothetical protein